MHCPRRLSYSVSHVCLAPGQNCFFVPLCRCNKRASVSEDLVYSVRIGRMRDPSLLVFTYVSNRSRSLTGLASPDFPRSWQNTLGLVHKGLRQVFN